MSGSTRYRIPFSRDKAAFDLLHSRAAGISNNAAPESAGSSSSGNSKDNYEYDPLRLQSRDSAAIHKMSTEFFALPGVGPNDISGGDPGDDRSSRQMCATDSWGATTCVEDTGGYVTNRSTIATGDDQPDDSYYGGVLSRNSWMIPMLALAAVNVCVIVSFEVYVVCKASRNTPSRRHLFLGQMLLLGLLIGSLVGFAYAVEPTDLSCAIIRLGTGISYALIYSSILVKLVFLISLNTGVYLPATYQALLFLFCVLVQIAIGIQWVSTSGPLCAFHTRDHILSLLYVIFLLIFSTSLAVKSRHYRDNYREAKYIGGLMAVSIPVWLAWIMAAIVLNESFHSACVGFGLLVCCAITFIVMFVPKSRQLSAIGKEGIYIEDQEDRFSLHSDRYSPSFYHFKPNKTMMHHHPSAAAAAAAAAAVGQHHGHHGSGGGGGGGSGSLYKEAIPDTQYFSRNGGVGGGGGGGGAAGNSYTGGSYLGRPPPPAMPPPPAPPCCREPHHHPHHQPQQQQQHHHPHYPGAAATYPVAAAAAGATSNSDGVYASLRNETEHLQRPRTSSVGNPNVYFYKSDNYRSERHPGFIY